MALIRNNEFDHVLCRVIGALLGPLSLRLLLKKRDHQKRFLSLEEVYQYSLPVISALIVEWTYSRVATPVYSRFIVEVITTV